MKMELKCKGNVKMNLSNFEIYRLDALFLHVYPYSLSSSIVLCSKFGLNFSIVLRVCGTYTHILLIYSHYLLLNLGPNILSENLTILLVLRSASPCSTQFFTFIALQWRHVSSLCQIVVSISPFTSYILHLFPGQHFLKL